MPLIDRTYFETELNIARTDEVSTQEIIDALIQKYEPEFLKAILGYALYKSFIAGLATVPVPAIWTNLLLGSEYTDRYGRLQEWIGLVSAPPVLINATTQGNMIDVVADAAAVLSQTINVPVSLIGRPWRLEKRTIGPLRTDEYDVSDDGTSVAFTAPIQLNETYWFYSNDLSLEQSTGDIKRSPIANYVYFQFQKNNASQTVSLGEASPTTENSKRQGPAMKQQRAWNEMTQQIHNCSEFLRCSMSSYPDFTHRQYWLNLQNFQYITRF